MSPQLERGIAQIKEAVTIPADMRIWIEKDHILVGNETMCLAITGAEVADGRHLKHAQDGLAGMVEYLAKGANRMKRQEFGPHK